MMKKNLLVSLLLVALFSCKTEKKVNPIKEEKVETSKSTAEFSIEKASKQINFTAYKTSDKIPVGGQFKKVNVLSGGEGNTVKEAIHNTEFSIPVSSLFTQNSSRDYKIKKFFFGIMDNTKLLSGKLLLTDTTNGVVEIKMNGVSQKVPFKYSIVDRVFNMKASMDVNNWNASKALASLNNVCLDLHRGADGISITWSEVTLNITTIF
jgi:hypothetical protein